MDLTTSYVHVRIITKWFKLQRFCDKVWREIYTADVPFRPWTTGAVPKLYKEAQEKIVVFDRKIASLKFLNHT